VRRLYSAVLERVDAAAKWAVIAAMAAMIAVVSLQVALRYLLNTSLDWSDEVSRLLFVWSIFLAIPLGIREGAHVGIDILAGRLPPAVRRWLAIATSLAAALVMAVLLYETIAVARETWDENLPTLDVSTGWFLVAVGISAGHSVLHLVQLTWRVPVRAAATPE
jgi:TRAP-type C4-dicarboxylate transport system permease small subunit